MAQLGLIPEDIAPDDLLETFNVSRESLEKLRRYVSELLHWQKSINLISPATVNQVWHRHICDGLQLCDHLSGEEASSLISGRVRAYRAYHWQYGWQKKVWLHRW